MGTLVETTVNWTALRASKALQPGQVAFVGTYRCWECGATSDTVVSPCPHWTAHPPDEPCPAEGCDGRMTMDLQRQYYRIVHPDSPPLESED